MRSHSQRVQWFEVAIEQRKNWGRLDQRLLCEIRKDEVRALDLLQNERNDSGSRQEKNLRIVSESLRDLNSGGNDYPV